MAKINIDKTCKPSFCIIVPMYNEENNVSMCVKTICNFLKKLENRCRLLVVDDGSSDETLTKLNKLKKKYNNLSLIKHPNNLGYGAANKTGVIFAHKKNYKYVLYMDADLTQNTKYIFDFIDLMNQNIDFIKATRYALGGGSKGVSKFRKIISKGGNLIASIFLRLPITDYTNGFRAIKTDLLINFENEENGFAYLIEEINKVSKKAKSYAEVPYILSVRNDLHSKSKFTYSIDVYLSYLKWLIK